MAMAKRKLNLTQEQVAEMMQLYETKAAPAQEIVEMFGISNGTFYRMLKRQGIMVHGAGGRALNRVGIKKIVPDEVEMPTMHSTSIEVVVDNHNLVQSTRPVRRPDSLWEVKYTGVMLVEADDVESAIREARKLGVVKRIYSVRIKGQ